jgi:hypothetical protein
MALASGLVGQPVQPYLTTGATDFVNSVQKGKEDAIKTETLKTTSQKSALDLLTAQKKQKDEQWYSDNAGALSRKVKTLDVADEDLAKMAQVNPEYHKVLQTEKADAVKNFNASNLAYLGSSTDKAKSAQEIIQASEAHGMTIPDQFKQSPETLMQYLRVINAGSKAFDLKNVSKDESGDIITTDITGNTTDIKPAAVKAPTPKPVYDSKGQPVMVTLPGTTKRGVKMDNGTIGETGTMPTPKAEERPSNYFPNDGLTGDEFLATLPKSEQSRILAIATARAKLPSYQAMKRDPTVARLVEGLYKAFPDYDETQFAIRQGAGKAFAYGKQGDKLRSFGTAVQHIETLLDIAKGLSTGDIKRANMVANLFGKETGSAPPVTMEAVQQLVADEILASIVPGAGGVEERLQLAKKLSGNNSYDVLKQVTERFQEMMKAQGGNLKRQAEYGGVDTSKMPDYTKHSADEGKTPIDNKGAYQLYVQHWNAAKNNPALQKKLTDRAREMGIVK